MMLVYLSRTRNIERIVGKMNISNTQRIVTGQEMVDQDFFLFTYTDSLGDVPDLVKKFLKNNHQYIKGVVGSGNKNFGQNFCKAARTISERCNVKLLFEFDLAGNVESIEQLRTIFIQSGGY